MAYSKIKGWLIGFMLCAFSFQQSQAQTFSEWFQQSKTQIKYLEQQIVGFYQELEKQRV
jgi:hypothetical protein